MAEITCTTVYNKHINGRDDPRSSNFQITPKIAYSNDLEEKN